MEAMQSKEAPGTLHATPSLNLYQLVAARCMNRLCTVSETAGPAPPQSEKLHKVNHVLLAFAPPGSCWRWRRQKRAKRTWPLRGKAPPDAAATAGHFWGQDSGTSMTSATWWIHDETFCNSWKGDDSSEHPSHTWRRNPTLHPNESNQLSSQSTLADIYTCCMYWSSSDQSTACMNACEHKTLNSHNWMEMLAMSATMMAYLRAVNDSETLPDLTRLGPANLKKIVHRVICGEGCWRKSYEVSWEKVFLWDMRSDLTLGYREASEAYQSVMLKWKVHKNAYQASQLLVLAQALYQT